MKRASFLTVGLLLLTTSALMAHHGTAGYDMSNMTSLEKATITEIEWTNPHCQIRFDGTKDKGVAEHWTLEAPPPSMLAPRETRASRNTGPSRLRHRACWHHESGPGSRCKRAMW